MLRSREEQIQTQANTIEIHKKKVMEIHEQYANLETNNQILVDIIKHKDTIIPQNRSLTDLLTKREDQIQEQANSIEVLKKKIVETGEQYNVLVTMNQNLVNTLVEKDVILEEYTHQFVDKEDQLESLQKALHETVNTKEATTSNVIEEEDQDMSRNIPNTQAGPEEETVENPVNTEDNVEELEILAAGKASGHTREGPQPKPEQKNTQIYCSLSSKTPNILCTFQCNSDNDLKKNIEKSHPTQERFPCAVQNCSEEYNNLYRLANHVSTAHLT